MIQEHFLIFAVLTFTIGIPISTLKPSQLLLTPPFAARNSSILAARFLNSSYWHFSYEWRSSWYSHLNQHTLSSPTAKLRARWKPQSIGDCRGKS